MVIPDQDCKCRTNDYPDFVRDPRKASEMALVSPDSDTRQMACQDARQVVVVDMREFRSEFCLRLHRRGIDVLPIMLMSRYIRNFF
jgi:ERCC4-type nuclease